MEKLSRWTEVLDRPFHAFLYEIEEAIPDIFAAVMILLIGWVVAKCMELLISKLLARPLFRHLSNNMANRIASGKLTKINFSKVLTGVIYWLILFFSLAFAAEVLGFSALSQKLMQLFDYLPRLSFAILIFIIGYYFINLIKSRCYAIFDVLNVRSRVILANGVYYLLLAIVTVTALSQAGVNTQIMTSNIVLLVGSFLLAFSIAFGLGAQHTLRNMLATLYAKRIFSEGDLVRIDDREIHIEKFQDVSIIFKTKDGKIVMSTTTFMNSKVEIITNEK